MRFVQHSICLALLACQSLAAHQDGPRQVRVQTLWVEMNQQTLNRLLDNTPAAGKKFHQAVSQQVSAKQAKLINSSILLARSGERGSLESIREIIYPTETHDSGLSGSKTGKEQTLQERASAVWRWTPTVFETRNAGVTLEMEPTVGANPNFIDLRFDYRWVQMPSIYSWTTYKDKWGEANIKRPIFYTMRSRSAQTLHNGQYQFVSSFDAMDAEGKADPTRKILFFVKAIVMPKP